MCGQSNRIRVRFAALAAAGVLVLCACQATGRADVKQSKAVPLTPANIAADAWAVKGDGEPIEGTVGFVQKGRTTFTATLGAPGAASYIVRGEVMLPAAGASLKLAVGVEANPNKAVVSGGAVLQKDAKTLRFSRRVQHEAPGVTETWLPFHVSVVGGGAAASVAGKAAAGGAVPAGATWCALALGRGAKVRALQVVHLPGGYVPLPVTSKANLDVCAKDGGLSLDAATVPKGVATIEGIPFWLAEKEGANALDVSVSFTGAKEPIRLKYYCLHDGSTARKDRLVLPVTGGQYSALHVLAFSTERDGTVPRMTVRIGYFGGASGLLEDRVVRVPALLGDGTGGDGVLARVPVKLAGGKAGSLFHLRVPMDQTGNLREFRALKVEFTRDVNVHVPVPDPFEFGVMPAGSPSGVVVLAATLEQSPLLVQHTTDEAGNVFFEKQKAVFKVQVTNPGKKTVRGVAFARCKGPGTGEETGIVPKEWTVREKFSVGAGETKEVPLDVTPKLRGWFACTVGVESGGVVLQRRDTSFAILAPDTRKAMEDSPFGVWAFWNAHAVAHTGRPQIDAISSLMLKGGWRWTYGGSPTVGRRAGAETLDEARRRLKDTYKVTCTLNSPPQGYQRPPGWYDEAEFKKTVIPWVKTNIKGPGDNAFKVLHESRSSSDVIRRYSELLGGAPYDMPAAEKERLESQFERVKKYCEGIKAAVPEARIVLINDYPAVGIEYMKRGFPKEAFDVWGSEGAMFMRQPERQPDWLCLLGQVHTWKRAMEKYGYDKPIWFTEALYHGTNPGNLSLHAQGVTAVREAALALALGVERLAAAGLIKDSTDDYRWSNWGSSGYCFREPENNPKPSYAMHAWLTQVLDQAKYVRFLPVDSTVVHVLEFQKPDGSRVYPMWVVRGRQEIDVLAPGGKPVLYDVFGNRVGMRTEEAGVYAVPLSDSPVYLTGTVVEKVANRRAIEVKGEPGKLLLDFDDPAALKPVAATNPVLEANWDFPRIKGAFRAECVTEDGASALRVELLDDKDERKLLPRYVELTLAKPITLTGRPYAFTMRIKGNGGWGRIMFELVDAQGRVWTSCGNQYSGACNSSDNRGYSFINFDGWHTIEVPLAGQYPGGDQFVHWARNSEWWPTNTPEAVAEEKAYQDGLKAHEKALADHAQAMKEYEKAKQAFEEAKKAGQKPKPIGKAPAKPRPPRRVHPGHEPVGYPVKLTKIIIATRPHILYVTEERPLRDRALYLDNLGVLDPPPGM